VIPGALERRGLHPNLRSVTIEAFIPSGPKFHYGLLGGFGPHSASTTVPTGLREGVWEGSLLTPTLDHVLVGLDPEYLGAVSAEVGKNQVTAIDEAACGEISSCNAIFRSLAWSIERIVLWEGEVTEATIRTLVEQSSARRSFV
jgi:hypothetical protein